MRGCGALHTIKLLSFSPAPGIFGAQVFGSAEQQLCNYVKATGGCLGMEKIRTVAGREISGNNRV